MSVITADSIISLLGKTAGLSHNFQVQYRLLYCSRYSYTSQKKHLPENHLPKKIPLSVLFPELTFTKMNTCQKLHFPRKTYFPEFSFGRN